MAYVVLDLEYNNMQGIFEELKEYIPENKEHSRYLYPNEIIQVGAVKLDDNFNIIDELNIYVKSFFYKNVNPAITEMTGVTQEQVDNGILYPEAFLKLSSFCNDAFIMTWGSSDIYELIRNCHMHKIPVTAIGTRFLDLQDYVGKRDFDTKTPSLKSAMAYYNIENDEEKLHDGLYDSICTAKVLKEFVLKHGNISEYKNTRILFSSDSIYITNVRVKDIPDCEITLRCPLCDGHIEYDISMTNEHGKIRSHYHCDDCKSSFIEDICVKENMMASRKYFKKIKKVPEQYYRVIVKSKQTRRANNY